MFIELIGLQLSSTALLFQFGDRVMLVEQNELEKPLNTVKSPLTVALSF